MLRKSTRKKGLRVSFIKVENGYRLERTRQEELEDQFNKEPLQKETSKVLRDLLNNLTIQSERDFLEEAIKCYEVAAYRATIVMGWLLTIDHLYEYVFAHHLQAFNVELAKVKDKRVKVSIITKKDDFSDMPESSFIEICRAATIISNDVRKILDTKLGIRNSSAHPSGIKILAAKATDFLQDLVTNIVQKYII